MPVTDQPKSGALSKLNSYQFNFTDKVKATEATDNMLVLRKSENLFDGLKRLEENSKASAKERGQQSEYETFNLVSTADGNMACCSKHTILQGQIGCATKFGRTHFIPPGNYFLLGLGVTVHAIRDLEPEGKKGQGSKAGINFEWKDISYVCLPESHVAVIQVGPQQFCIGAGRYILRRPVTLYGVVDIQSLKNKTHAFGINEGGDASGKDTQVKVKMKSGEWQKCGSLTFIRAQPGFSFVIQDPSGHLRSGIGFDVARGGELYKTFVDMQHYARTTRPFHLESKDRQEMLVRAQIRWCIVDPKFWLLRRGAYSDIFDAIEEIMQSLLRDYMARHTYEECRAQQSEGYTAFERLIRPILEKEMSLLGGKLLGFEMRSIRFPLLEQRNAIRAQKEAKMKEKLLEEKRALELEVENRKRVKARIEYAKKHSVKKQEHAMHLSGLQNSQDVQRQTEKAKLDEAAARSRARRALLVIEAKLKQETLEENVKISKSEAKASRRLQIANQQSQQMLAIAKANAAAMVAEAEAKAEGIIKEAEARAKAATLIGSAYKANPSFLKFKMSELQAQVLKQRATALAEGLAKNKGAMIPPHLQAEIIKMQGTLLGGDSAKTDLGLM